MELSEIASVLGDRRYEHLFHIVSAVLIPCAGGYGMGQAGLEPQPLYFMTLPAFTGSISGYDLAQDVESRVKEEPTFTSGALTGLAGMLSGSAVACFLYNASYQVGCLSRFI